MLEHLDLRALIAAYGYWVIFVDTALWAHREFSY